MARYIAFLRAINVGGHTVKMERLRALFEELEFGNVETFIASGNVIFESSARSAAKLEERIAKHLHDSLGYQVATFIRTPAELAAVASYRPFPVEEIEAPGAYLYIAFLGSALPAASRDRLLARNTATDEFHVHDREIYWLCRTKISDSPVSGAMMERAIGQPATMRNSTTVRKMAAKYEK